MDATKSTLSNEKRLKPGLELALKDCAEYSNHRPYIWKPKSMKKLAELGYVQPEVLAYCGQTPYSLTDKGRAYLEAKQVAGETIVGWMVGDPNDNPAMYNRQQQEEAFDAARRWNSPITALVTHPSTPEFARGQT